jgi:hypothetical protein
MEGDDGSLGEKSASDDGEGEENERVVACSEGKPNLTHVESPCHRVKKGDSRQNEEGCNGVGDGKVECALNGRWFCRFETAQRESSGATSSPLTTLVTAVSSARLRWKRPSRM